MKSRWLVLLALVCLTGTSTLAQDLAGTWQGTLSIQGNQLRVVFRVTTGPDGKLTGRPGVTDFLAGAFAPGDPHD